ncbi:hypothetical protein HPB49_015295 [Dermacentor silvarum]|uniref:Uncharacterized protein n=1 Tax=Dermacentor silvarum TaxID=543639 RepID=A0ACB8CRK4_DERSI|nr:hypothetical protein HPB49_015295 [Dermacentor silvarum]
MKDRKEEQRAFAALFGRYDFLSHDRMTHFIVTTICRYPVTRAICPWIINVIAGQQTRPINAVYTTRRFGKFDYGAQRNIEVYGKGEECDCLMLSCDAIQATPPEYDFRRVSAPVALFWSQADALVSAEHMATLREKLPNLVLDFRVADDRFSHQEFAIGVTAKEAVYDDLVDIMKCFSGQG